MIKTLQIDFVSDVACPWCAVGLNALEQALQKLQGEIQAQIRFQPFELNPTMGPEGEDTMEHLMRKYGASREQMLANQKVITERGAEVGFRFNLDARNRVWNTFDAHRLLHWAGTLGRQRALKHRLLQDYLSEGRNPSDHAVLLEAVNDVGLDVEAARAILSSDQYALEVRQDEQHWQRLGISSVPSIVINRKHLIQGGQPVDVFVDALRQVAEEEAAGPSLP